MHPSPQDAYVIFTPPNCNYISNQSQDLFSVIIAAEVTLKFAVRAGTEDGGNRMTLNCV